MNQGLTLTTEGGALGAQGAQCATRPVGVHAV
jgi:hypothetical protein